MSNAEKYLNIDEAIHYLIKEYNACDLMIFLMVKRFYSNAHSIVPREYIDKWVRGENGR